MPGGFYGNWRRRAPDPKPDPDAKRMADVTVLVARVRDGSFEACVELAQMSGVTTVEALIEVISPTKRITPLTFELVCKALEFVEMYPIKEKS